MSRKTTGRSLGITKDQFRAITLLAQGWPYDRVAQVIWDVTDGNGVIVDAKMKDAQKTLRKWLKDPKISEAYREYVKEDIMPTIMKSIRRIDAQVDDSNGWLANKAANDILTRFGSILMGEEDKTIRVQITGMPELGEPDD